jgi:tetratricopeptide (TPR) repeat protein/WD40 repeat protein
VHPTAPFVALSSYHHHTVELRDLRTGRTVAEVDPPWPQGMGVPDWSPDGRTLAVPSGDTGQIQLYAFAPAAATLRPDRTIEGILFGGGLDVTFSPTGDRLAGRIWGGIVHLYDVHTGRTLFTTHALSSTWWGRLRFDPKGARLAAARVGDRQDHIGVWSVADDREHRVLVPRRRGAEVHGRFAVHPGGRLAAMNVSPGDVALFDLETGAEIGFIPIHRAGGNDLVTSVAFDGTGALLTNGFCGLLRWPIRAKAANPSRWTVGPPEPLPFHPGDQGVAASGDGKVVAQTMWFGYGMDKYAGGWILHPNSPRPRWVERGSSMNEAAVSRDGRVAILQGRVYETATGKRLWQAPDGTSCRMSPDGRWLVTNADGGRVFAFGTWEPGVRLGGGNPRDVSPDSTLVVMALPNGIYRLVELATGRELAQLEEPEQTRTEAGAVFTPDGTRLLVGAKDSLRVWDLRLLRQRLKELDLDWEAPSYPEAPGKKPGPLEVQVLGAELTDRRKRAEHQWQSALAALFFNPFDADAHLRLGRHLLERGNAERAHAHLGAALAFRPGLDEALYPRAMAGYRLGRWKEALADLTRHLRRYPQDAEAYHLRGHLNEALHRYGDAGADFSASLKREPNDPRHLACRASAYLMLGQHADAAADCRKSLEVNAEQAGPNWALAWIHANGPAPFRDPRKALPFAQRAVALEAKVSRHHHVLGVVYYRLGRWKEAVGAFERGLEMRGGKTTAYYDFFLAMCHAKLGDPARAKDCFDRAVKWTAGQKGLPARHAEELKAFRAEAEEVLRSEPRTK